MIIVQILLTVYILIIYYSIVTDIADGMLVVDIYDGKKKIAENVTNWYLIADSIFYILILFYIWY